MAPKDPPESYAILASNLKTLSVVTAQVAGRIEAQSIQIQAQGAQISDLKMSAQAHGGSNVVPERDRGRARHSEDKY